MLSKKEYDEQILNKPRSKFIKRKTYEEYVKEYKETQKKINKIINK